MWLADSRPFTHMHDAEITFSPFQGNAAGRELLTIGSQGPDGLTLLSWGVAI